MNPTIPTLKKLSTTLPMILDPKGCKKLKGRDAYRIRIANYRAIYEVNDEILLVDVINVGHRKDVYK
jgi:mRNA interferase RelE/StbE